MSAQHGTRSKYTTGCRCDDCRSANRKGERARRRALGVPPAKRYTPEERAQRRSDKEKRQAPNKQNAHLRRSYGITVDEKQALFVMQGSVCACCGGNDPRSPLGWSVEHDHETNDLRGIVCNECNRLIAAVGDNYRSMLETVQRLTDYFLNISPMAEKNLALIRGIK